MFGITIARATSVRSLLRIAARAEPAYEKLRLAVRHSPWVVPDETGWRVGGRNAWLHVLVAGAATRAWCADAETPQTVAIPDQTAHEGEFVQ